MNKNYKIIHDLLLNNSIQRKKKRIARNKTSSFVSKNEDYRINMLLIPKNKKKKEKTYMKRETEKNRESPTKYLYKMLLND